MNSVESDLGYPDTSANRMTQAQSADELVTHFLQGLRSHFPLVLFMRPSAAGLVCVQAVVPGQKQIVGFGDDVIALADDSAIKKALEDKHPYVVTNMEADATGQQLANRFRLQGNAVVLPVVLKGKSIFVTVAFYHGELSNPARSCVAQLGKTLVGQLDKLTQRRQHATGSQNAQPDPVSSVEQPHQPSLPDAGGAETEQTCEEIDSALVEVIAAGELRVPPYPAVAEQLNRLISSESYSFHDLAAVIKADQVLSVDVLRYANSAHYRAADEVRTVEKAIGRIGVRSLVSLSLSSGLGKVVSQSGALAEIRYLVWRQALVSAHLCEQLAAKRHLDASEAFICGLLHDFGKVITLTCIEQILATKKDDSVLPLTHWLQLTEKRHVELGKIVAQRWKLPELIANVIEHHHSPVDGPQRALVDLVIATDQVNDLLEEKPHVAPEDLAQLQSAAGTRLFADKECQNIAQILPQLAAMAEHPESSSSYHSASLVEKSKTTLREARPFELAVIHQASSEQVEYKTVAIAADGLAMRGRQPLEENTLVNLELATQPSPTRVWARTTLCQKQADLYQIEVHTYALTADAHMRWREMYEAAMDS